MARSLLRGSPAACDHDQSGSARAAPLQTAGNRAFTTAVQRWHDARSTGGQVAGDENIDDRSGLAAPPLEAGPDDEPSVQRRIGDGHDLTNARFRGDIVLEACFDNERLLRVGASGDHVRKVQEALVALGFTLPRFGPDGSFGSETAGALKQFQTSASLTPDTIIGPLTMGALDTRAPSGGGGGGVTPPPPPPPAVITASVGRVRASSTPRAHAPDRIPPRTATNVAVTVSGADAANPVTVRVTGQSAANGTVTVNGGPTATLAASASVTLRGGRQTTPGNTGNLRLVVQHGTRVLARSPVFSVAAIPRNWSITHGSDLRPDPLGFVVNDRWSSDSGVVADLGECEISEQVQQTVQTGCFAGLGATNSGYLPATAFTTDTHSSPRGIMTSPGRRLSDQTSIYLDRRTGVRDIPMTRSGYLIRRNVVAGGSGPGGHVFTITKAGGAATANGFASTAGAGAATPFREEL